jgi:uncharacterized membrane protein (DUF106 family)
MKQYIYICFIIIIIYFFLIQILGLTNPTPLNRNLVLEICKERVYTHLSQHICTNKNHSMMHNLLATHGSIRPYYSS